MLLKPQVHALVLWWAVVERLRNHDWRDDRGDAYTSTIMIAVGVVIAITVGGILLVKFTQKAESIDTNTPTGPVAPGP